MDSVNSLMQAILKLALAALLICPLLTVAQSSNSLSKAFLPPGMKNIAHSEGPMRYIDNGWYWNVRKTWEVTSLEPGGRYSTDLISREGAAPGLNQALANSRWACLEGNSKRGFCKRPALVTQIHRLPNWNCTLSDIKDLGWEHGHKTNYCIRLGYDGLIAAGYWGWDYEDGGYCYKGNGAICKARALEQIQSYHVTAPHDVGSPHLPPFNSCKTTAVYMTWKKSKWDYRDFVGYGKDSSSAANEGQSRCIKSKLGCDGKPYVKERALDCTSCTFVDLRNMGWTRGNKTQFCKTHGYEGVRTYSDDRYDNYEDGGVCYSGPGCANIKHVYP